MASGGTVDRGLLGHIRFGSSVLNLNHETGLYYQVNTLPIFESTLKWKKDRKQ